MKHDISSYSRDALLASYATKHSASRGRVHTEPAKKSARLPYERDRDRIIHSNAFRRLQGKTQVFVAGSGDYFRTRLTHSIEVAQVSRSIARALRLNEDLVEAIGLAHDLGHSPFAHGGEEAMNEVMQKHGSRFEHNEQSKKTVEQLEWRYPWFPGLNLTLETLEGLSKHESPWDNPFKKDAIAPSLEAQVVNFGDEIAYTAHDIDDGIRGKFFDIVRLKKLGMIRRVIHTIRDEHGLFDDPHALRYQLIRRTIGFLIESIVTETERRLAMHRIQTTDDVHRCAKPLVGFPKYLEKDRLQLRTFLYKHFYLHPRIIRGKKEGQRIIKKLFTAYLKHPRLLPSLFQARINSPDPLIIVIKDYIAGMTDNFAREQYERLTSLK